MCDHQVKKFKWFELPENEKQAIMDKVISSGWGFESFDDMDGHQEYFYEDNGGTCYLPFAKCEKCGAIFMDDAYSSAGDYATVEI